MKESPFEGIEKPEVLKYELAGFWSRRINWEHRIIHKVPNGMIEIHSLKGHYD
jgi:toxin YoeB